MRLGDRNERRITHLNYFAIALVLELDSGRPRAESGLNEILNLIHFLVIGTIDAIHINYIIYNYNG